MTFLMAASRATGRIGCDEIAKRLAHLFHATKVLGQVTNSAAKFCYDGPGPVAPELLCTAAIVPCLFSRAHVKTRIAPIDIALFVTRRGTLDQSLL